MPRGIEGRKERKEDRKEGEKTCTWAWRQTQKPPWVWFPQTEDTSWTRSARMQRQRCKMKSHLHRLDFRAIASLPPEEQVFLSEIGLLEETFAAGMKLVFSWPHLTTLQRRAPWIQFLCLYSWRDLSSLPLAGLSYWSMVGLTWIFSLWDWPSRAGSWTSAHRS